MPATAELLFLGNGRFQDSLRLDISEMNRALAGREWKSATVLAGSVIEALLLWALQGRDDTDAGAVQNRARRLRLRHAEEPLTQWNLSEYIEVAADLELIHNDTRDQARLAQNFRNLIHPGRGERLGQECNRGTALSAIAAVEHVVRDLTLR